MKNDEIIQKCRTWKTDHEAWRSFFRRQGTSSETEPQTTYIAPFCHKGSLEVLLRESNITSNHPRLEADHREEQMRSWSWLHPQGNPRSRSEPHQGEQHLLRFTTLQQVHVVLSAREAPLRERRQLSLFVWRESPQMHEEIIFTGSRARSLCSHEAVKDWNAPIAPNSRELPYWSSRRRWD